MTDQKPVKHFNKGTVWGRVDGVPTRKLSDEGKGRPYYRLKVLCPSQRGNVFAYGRIWAKGPATKTANGLVWDEKDAKDLIDYLKKNPNAGIKLVGFLNQYDHQEKKDGKVVATMRRSNFTWYHWQPDKCEDPRAAFALVGVVAGVKDDMLMLHLEREGSDPEDFTLYARDLATFEERKILQGDTVQVKGYLQSKSGEDEFGCTEDAAILPCFDVDDLKIRGDDFV